MARDDLRPVDTVERRHGRRDRRINIPEGWPEGRRYLETELGDLWTRTDVVADDVHAIRRLLERFGARQGMMLAIGGAVGAGMLTLFYFMAQHFITQARPPPPLAEAARIEAIADVLPDVPRTSSLRLQSGARRGYPKVSVLQGMLPGVHVTAADRDAACRRLAQAGSDACQP